MDTHNHTASLYMLLTCVATLKDSLQKGFRQTTYHYILAAGIQSFANIHVTVAVRSISSTIWLADCTPGVHLEAPGTLRAAELQGECPCPEPGKPRVADGGSRSSQPVAKMGKPNYVNRFTCFFLMLLSGRGICEQANPF
jgi:hypothetical protein